MAVGKRSKEARSKPLMLFVHGFPEAWFSWRYQLLAFQDSHEVAAVELRGYGLSDKPKVTSQSTFPGVMCRSVRMQYAWLAADVRQCIR